VQDIEQAMPNVRSLIGAARSAGVPIVFVRSIYDEQYLSPAMKDQKERRGSRKICQTGSWGAEFYGGVAPDHGRAEIVVVKHRFNAFWGTELDTELHKRGITRLVTCGLLLPCASNRLPVMLSLGTTSSPLLVMQLQSMTGIFMSPRLKYLIVLLVQS
jgi:nicotinamidase-related amidase